MAEVLPDTPHQFCHARYLKNLAEPLSEMDSAFNVTLRKAVRQEVGSLIRGEQSISSDQAVGLLTMTGLFPDQIPAMAEPKTSSTSLQTAVAEASATSADEIVDQLLRRMRYLLTLKGRPPFRLAGSESYQGFQDLLDFSAELLAHRYDPRLFQLHQGLQTALEPLAEQHQDLQLGSVWLREIDHILSQPDAESISGVQVAQQLRTHLDELLQLPDISPRLDAFRHHLHKVSKNYWSGLFYSYDLAELPRTNNELESHFRDSQRRLLRTTGQKGQTRRSLHRFGAWELLVRPTTSDHSLAAIRQVSPQKLAQERQRMRRHLERFRLHTRSPKQTKAQFDKLRQQWLALAATSTG